VSALPVLVRHFRSRYFDPDEVGAGGDAGLTAANLVTCLAAPGVFLPFFLLFKYLRLQGHPIDLLDAVWDDRCLFLTVAMAVTGLATLLTWDAVFPDEKDYRNLLPLPVPLRILFLAKLTAGAQLVLIFTTAASAVSTFLFPALAGEARGGDASYLRFAAAHGLALAAACLFTFLALSGVQGLLLAVLGPSWARRLSPVAQGLSLMSLLLLLFRLRDLRYGWRYQRPDALAWEPPLWFLQLYARVLGRQASAAPAGWALAAAGLLFLIAYAGAYLRFASRSLGDAIAPRRRLLPPWGWLAPREPGARGVYHFALATARRSARHRLLLSGFLGLGLALAVPAFLQDDRSLEASTPLLAVPLALCFLLLAGLRLSFGQPAQLKAAWIFELLVVPQDQWWAGARRACFTMVTLPIALVAFPLAVWLWGPWIAAAQLAYDLLLGALLAELLLPSLRGLPYAHPYLPGSANLKLSIVPWILAFSGYAYGMARVELNLLTRPAALLAFLAAGTAALALLRVQTRRRLGRVEPALRSESALGLAD